MRNASDKLPPLCAKYGHQLGRGTRGVEQILEDFGALDRIAVALASEEQNNVALTGPAGCGKTSTSSRSSSTKGATRASRDGASSCSTSTL